MRKRVNCLLLSFNKFFRNCLKLNTVNKKCAVKMSVYQFLFVYEFIISFTLHLSIHYIFIFSKHFEKWTQFEMIFLTKQRSAGSTVDLLCFIRIYTQFFIRTFEGLNSNVLIKMFFFILVRRDILNIFLVPNS